MGERRDNGYGYENMRFRNIEPEYNFDTTFTDSISIDLEFPAGEGYLFQVAPVVKYGGRLIYDEAAGEDQILTDDMIIENGATLTIYDNYNAEANIIVKDGSIVNGENGKIIFKYGTKLIIEGAATINGISGDKLTLIFDGPDTENGIVVDSAASLTISNCIIEDAETGIKAMMDARTINVQYVDFNDCRNSSITLLGETGGAEVVRQVRYCTISNSQYGISAANLYELIIQENDITNTDLGINLSSISRAVVQGNIITSNTKSLPGIFFESTGGEIQANIISGHTNGIHLGNSSPDLGSNVINDNLFHGIYIGAGSLPNMVVGSWIGDPPVFYATSGYNKIYENGGTTTGGPLDNDGSEIYFSSSNALMREGCNSIYDDRLPGGEHPPYNTKLLMNGIGFGGPIEIHAEFNYWSNNPLYPLEERFGSLIVEYDPYYPAPCPEPQEGVGGGLLSMSSGGEVIDTLYPVEGIVPELTATELLYAKAEEDFVTANYADAKQIYEQIINSQATLAEKIFAYKRIYQIGKLTHQSSEFFSTLGETFTSLSSAAEDTLLKKIFSQFSTLCLVSEGKYISAITEFDEVVQQNQGSEEAIYAEIDALTTALLIEGNDSTLNKGSLGKYLIKTSGDYFSKIDGILRKNFGSRAKTEEKEMLPEEYTLYQNYPNPFNPVTTIKYDLPKAGEVELVVYDILGRKVKTLVNQTQQAGRYDIQFNASSLASGVYIYQLRTKDFVNSKKMILLK